MIKKVTLFLFILWGFGSIAFAGTFDLGLNYASGVSEKKGVNTSFKVKRGSFTFGLDFNYARQDEDTAQDNLGFGVGYDKELSKKWSYWIFNLSKYDRLQKINIENFFGGGPKYTFIKNENLTVLSLSGGILQHYIDYENIETKNLTRFSGRLTTGFQITKDIRFGLIGFYQPDIGDFNDYIIRIMTDLSQSITKTVSLKFKIHNLYRSVTEAKKNNDFTSTLALSVIF